MDVVLQSEAAECGIACVAMVASYHGNKIGLRELRQRHSMSLKGATLGQLIEVSGSLSLQCRPLRLELADLDQLSLPCIVHWDLNHFVVVSRVSRGQVTVLDPAYGKRKLPLGEFSRHFTGVALELSPGADFQVSRSPKRIGLSQLTGKVTGLYRALSTVLGLSLSLQVFVLLAPFFMQWVVDQALVSSDRDLLTVLGVGFGLALLLQVAIGVVRGWAVIYLSSRLGLQWTSNVFQHMIRLPIDFFEKRYLGDITSRMSSVQSIQRTMTTSFVEALIDGLMAVCTLGMMLLYSWKLAAVSLVAVTLYACARALSFGPLRAGTEQQLVATARQHSHLLESIRGVQSVKVAGREQVRQSTYTNLLGASINRDVWLARFGLGFNGTSQLIFGIERIAVVWIGALLAMQSVFSVGMLIAYLAYKDQFSSRVAVLIDRMVEFRMLRLHGERLSDIVLATAEPSDGDFSLRLPSELRIEVEGLGFKYASSEPWIVRNCSFVVEAGESVAIVGPSGCGKTTLVKLLLGLLEPTEGSIRVGGVPLEKVGKQRYRKLIGAVMQEDQLFAGSIADNISFNAEDVDEDRVRESAKLAAVHDDISAMPMGYGSLIGDMGTTLSGGQKQRVLLARALYREPSILFLDEATSHLDVERERLVNIEIQRLALTRIIIAHRPETIASAQRVLMMSAGAVSEILRPGKATSTGAPRECSVEVSA